VRFVSSFGPYGRVAEWNLTQYQIRFYSLALPQPISIIRSSNMNSLLFPCSSSAHLHYSEQLHEFAFIPFLFPAHLPYSSAALAHSLNSLLVGSCSPAHDCRWRQLSLRIDHSAIAAFGLCAGRDLPHQGFASRQAGKYVDHGVPEPLQRQHQTRSIVQPKYRVVWVDQCYEAIKRRWHPCHYHCGGEQQSAFTIVDGGSVGI
jgi:hypothetical protein